MVPVCAVNLLACQPVLYRLKLSFFFLSNNINRYRAGF